MVEFTEGLVIGLSLSMASVSCPRATGSPSPSICTTALYCCQCWVPSKGETKTVCQGADPQFRTLGDIRWIPTSKLVALSTQQLSWIRLNYFITFRMCSTSTDKVKIGVKYAPVQIRLRCKWSTMELGTNTCFHRSVCKRHQRRFNR